MASLFSDWHSKFYARGRFEDRRPEMTSYGYDEQEGKRHTVLTVSDGEITRTQNGRPRPARPAPEGLDVLTAFFISPECWVSQLVHTGRSNYWIERGRRPSTNTDEDVPNGTSPGIRCAFRIGDEDGDQRRVDVDFVMRDGQLVPASVRIHGWLRGTIRLREPEPPAALARASMP